MPHPTAAKYMIREMLRSDYATVRALWERTENIGLNESDEEVAIASFLARNVGLSAVATIADGRLVGALLCGHDGRRGYLHHLAVAPEQRGQGLGRQLVEFAEAGLRRAGIAKVNLFVFGGSDSARSFWEHQGWRRPEWQVMQKRISGCGSGDGCTC
jgi:N-acetylglutamate synthase